jgi:two-component system response regulator AtoC
VNILVVDDDRGNRESIQRYLESDGFKTAAAENGLAAQRFLAERAFDAAVVDLKMPGMDGLEFLRWLSGEGIRMPVVMVSAFGEIRDAVEAMKLGARDYVVKPFDPEELVIRLRRTVEDERARARVELGRGGTVEGLTGTSRRIQEIRRVIEKIAPTETTVLLTGESGTGKEVVARQIHTLSGRSEGPFVPVNVGGIPETLLESELFGYEKGAFTGADERKTGMYEVATRGTLFLDEIGDMPLPLQVKLLRVLQDKTIRRLGGTRSIPVDARIVAATNRRLEDRVAEGAFREDLYYRLNVVRIEVPPLRERPEDVALLAGLFIKTLGARMGKQVKGLDDEALARLAAYPFPGNVRELENMIERSLIFSEGEQITAADLSVPQTREKPVRAESMRDIEKRAIADALLRWEGNRTRAAEELGISRRTLITKIKEYGLS